MRCLVNSEAPHADLSTKAATAKAHHRAEQYSGWLAGTDREKRGRADQAGGLEQASAGVKTNLLGSQDSDNVVLRPFRRKGNQENIV
jgi:hypothetical protein